MRQNIDTRITAVYFAIAAVTQAMQSDRKVPNDNQPNGNYTAALYHLKVLETSLLQEKAKSEAVG